MCANRRSSWLKRIALLVLFSAAAGSTASAQTPQETRDLETTLIPGTTVWITDSGGREDKAQIVGVSGDVVTAAAADEVRRFRMTDVSASPSAQVGLGAEWRPDWGGCWSGVGAVPVQAVGALGELSRRRRTDAQDWSPWRRHRHRHRCPDPRTTHGLRFRGRIDTAARRAHHRSPQERPAGLAQFLTPWEVGVGRPVRIPEHESTRVRELLRPLTAPSALAPREAPDRAGEIENASGPQDSNRRLHSQSRLPTSAGLRLCRPARSAESQQRDACGSPHP